MPDGEVSSHRWTAPDGVELTWRELGAGRPVVLLHGLFSSAHVNWIKFGTAERIAREGFRVIMPDHRAHGDSAAPSDAALYPAGVLARDVTALIDHLDLKEFDLGGFSLGARTVVQAVGKGLRPRRAILSGMGLQGLEQWQRRQQFFIDAIDRVDTSVRGDPHWMSIQFMKTMKIDPVAARLLLQTYGDTDLRWLDQFTMPTLVLIGRDDDDNGSARDLADRLPDSRFVEIPGTHMDCVTKPEMGEAMATFLAG